MSQSARIKIRELRALLDDGLLSPQEFEQRKNAILDAQLAPSVPHFALHVQAANSAPVTELGLMAGQEIGPVNKRYRLERFLGQGGMGQVWQALDLATHAQLGQSEQVALKILPPQLTQSMLHTKLLVEEATQARKLAHEHIVRVYEWAQDPATTSYFIIMELLEGRDLQTHLSEHGPFSHEQVQTLLSPVAHGLRYAWDKHQLVHRDLKPGNLFLTSQGEVKLLDFGIAARLHSSGSALGLQLPANAGTVGYRAPEASGPQTAPGPQLDVYSVAVMIYQLLAGQLPFGEQQSNMQVVTAPPGINLAQWTVLQKGFAFKPQERPKSVLELLRAMQLAAQPAVLQLDAQRSKPAPVQTQVPEQVLAARRQAEVEARLQERRREQQERTRRQLEARERAAHQLKRVAQEQQKQLAENRAREEALAESKRQAMLQQQESQQRAMRRLAVPAVPLSTPVSPLAASMDKLMQDLFADCEVAASLLPPLAEPTSKQLAVIQAGTGFQDAFLDGSGDAPELIVLPAGRFLMGSSDTERLAAIAAGSQRAWLERETPQHWVQFAQPVAIGKYPVTRAQWQQFVQETAWVDDASDTVAPDFVQDDEHPVVCISWRDANLYVAWLSEKTGQRYRLPSEAEWEYACRAGTSSAFSFGDTITPEQANYDGNFTYNASAKGRFRRGTSRVGSYAANAWGIYDMHGNVWEWVADVVHDNYQGAPQDGSAWQQGGDQGRRILRGGCWLYSPRYLRSALRNAFWVAGKNDIVGFRVARELDE